MADIPYSGKFIDQAEAVILEHIANEQFGVSELADLMHMSRSSLLRKIKKQTQLSASQFIRQVRLQKGMKLLEETELTVSEISDHVGFGNNSYFIKCFREQYGYSPGEVRKISFEKAAVHDTIGSVDEVVLHKSFFNQYRLHIIMVTSLVLL